MDWKTTTAQNIIQITLQNQRNTAIKVAGASPHVYNNGTRV